MTEKQMGVSRKLRVGGAAAAAAVLTLAGVAAGTAVAQQQGAYPGADFPTAPQLQLLPTPVATPITPNGKVVERVIARVNDQIITNSEYQRALQGLLQTAQQQNEDQAQLDDQEKNLLRDMIDQDLLLSKGKELGITGDAETMRELDNIRKQNHLDSMEALQKAAEAQGISFEDFKQDITNHIISQEVVSQEVGRHLEMTHAQEVAYYDAHKQQFAVPEQVHLSEILIPTSDNPTDAQVAEAQSKADAAEAKLKAGANFADLAKQVSGGPTASAGGDLGDFKRGTLGTVLENATFSLPVGGFTEPIRTRQGFVILKVDAHQQAGVPPLSQVEPQVQEALYMQEMQPALRAYLSKARDEAYIDIAPGYVDTGANNKESKPIFTAYSAPKPKKKVVRKERLEQEKQQRAEEALATARERLREQREAKAEAMESRAGVRYASEPTKHHKIRREKIRYGQAPRMALPAATTDVAAENNGPVRGESADEALASSVETRSISTGTAADTYEDNPLTTHGHEHKTRFTSMEAQYRATHAKKKLVRVEEKVDAHPVEATPEEAANEKEQDRALGLDGNTGKKKHHHHHRVKGEKLQRIEEKPKEKPAAPAPAPTVNPALAGAPVAQPAAGGTTAQ